MSNTTAAPGNTWLLFALMTVACWGVYGAFLHTGQMGMADPVSGRYKAFFMVGIAYFLTAVVAPFLMLVKAGASWHFWNYPQKGLWWSLIAGIVGALGAFGVLLAFGAKGTPAVVMSIVFAGAPVINAIYTIVTHPPEGGIGSIKPQFFLGIILAAVGGCLVTLYKPNPPVKKPGAVASAAPNANTPRH